MNIEQERAEFEAWLYLDQVEYDTDDLNKREIDIAKLAYQAGRAALQSQDRETCSWSYDESDGVHQTSCGNMHIIIDGTPEDNGMKYCCYCGGRITPAIDHASRAEGDGE